MKLAGRYLSPFVRRVATTMHWYDMPYEHVPLATQGEDRDRIQALNPVTRVPALTLDDGEVIVDSAAILDYLDELVGPERALTPASGPERRRILKLMAIAAGAAEKAVLTVYEERFRPEDKRHAPWTDMCGGQARDALAWLDGEITGPWFTGEQMSQADVTAICCHDFIRIANPALYDTLECPGLSAMSQRANDMPAFKATYPPS